MSNSVIDSQIVAEMYSQPQTLIELLRSRTYKQSDQLAYTFLVDEGIVETTLTYGELDQRARSIAARLQSIVEVGDRVLLLYPPGLEYIAAFFGCLYAGAIAVPAYPPRNNRNLHRLQTLVQNAEPVVSLTTSTILSRIAPHVSQNSYLAPLIWEATDQIPDWVANDWREPSISGDSLAFLQYTSGSTSAPKGVMVSHQNLLHNERLIQSVFQQTDQSVIVGWLPLYHDMGLIGNVIQPLFVGAPCILMSPMAFLQKPFRWLQAISRYRATTSGGPNFAYDLCVRKINDEQRATLDLSSWQVAFNGAEPVRPETLERFAAAFAPCGFAFDAFRPCYGLAEATLLVSGRTGNEPLVATTVETRALEAGHAIETTSAVDVRTLVNCGGALAQDKVVIVDPTTLTECAPGAVGEIWVAGPGVAQGYWNDPAETDRIFRAYLRERGEGPFLRTEDLGFLLDGKLFVTGRLKDLIIIRGLNHYPQDIELTVERYHSALRPGCCAAFSVDVAGEERLVIVQEVDQRRQFRAETVIESINEAVAREHELQAHAIVLVTPGTVPKTSSGKIQRYACREAFLRGALEVVAEQRGIEYTPAKLEDELAIPDRHDRQAVEFWLRAQIASKLNIDLQQVDVSQPLTRYGLDSLAAIELAHLIENNFDIAVPLTAFLEGTSIAELATRVVEQQQLNSGERRHPTGEPIARTSAPLSVGQRALWFLQQVDPESAAYNLFGALRVLSPLDAPALQRAFEQLVKRHVSLRTTFPSRDGEPAVSVHEDVKVDFIVHDSSAWDDAAVSQYLTDEAHRPFDLEVGPLLRVRLLSRSGPEQVLLLCFHHIIADQWSLAVLLNELGVLYEAECTGALVTLPELRSQYADYASWQEKLLSGESGERLLSYWKKQLAGELPNLNLPTDRPYPPVQTYHGASHLFRLNADLTRSLKEVSCARDATLYMTLMAAFQVLLHGYTDQEDILIGSPAAGRSLAEFANVVGYFVNPLVIRADLTGNATFEAVLSRTRQTVLEAFEHQDYPFPLLPERLQPARDASRSPIFQAMFSMQNTPLGSGAGLTALAVGEPGAKLQLGKLHLESLPLAQQAAMFDITLRMAEVEGELLASLQYNTDLFDPATVTRMAEHFQTLLDGIVTDPNRRLSELSLLTRAESRLLAEWNKTDRDYEQPYCMHELFEQQVERSPEAVALVFEDKQLSYAELNELANQLAKRLLQFGIKTETRIGLCVERSFEMVIGLLGILKAGGAFVPLNPSDPLERLSFMFEDSGARVLLTQKRFGHLLPANQAHVIYLDEPYSEPTGPVTGSSVDVCPENLAYVIYTSGSTGQPKGAMNAHKAIVNRLLWGQETYGLGPGDSVLQKTPFTFDVSVWEFFWPLLVGARLVVARPGGHQDPAYLAQLIRAEQVTTLHFVPSMLHVFLDEPTVRDCRSLKRVICSGEAVPLALQERFFQSCDAELHNLYGPTETAVEVTVWACERDSERLTVPIGRPIANTQIHLLDRHLRQTPVGVVGELYIGGIPVGRGYCDRPELTAERFIPDPIGAAGARLYKTGDLARYLADGSIEYLGRVDHQVKLRGQRIELGEIEAVLVQHQAVQEAVVVVREYGPSDGRLVAYLVPDRRKSETNVVFASDVISENGVGELKKDFDRYLRERLPSYMVPSTFVFLDKFPVTSSGKVDRRALPAPKQDRSELAEDFVEPRNEAEQTLAEIWANVLQSEKVGIHDNFFALGGDSILAIQIVARANRAGLDLSPRQLFQYQTIAQLAAVAGTSQHSQAEQIAITGAVPLTPVQHWFFEHNLPNPHHWNQSVLLEMRRAIDPVLLERVFRYLFAHHDALRLRFTWSESVWKQSNAAVEDALPFSTRDLSTLSDSEQEAAVAAAAAELQTSLNITTGPMLRAAYFDFGPDKPGKLLLAIHHLVVDGISWRILLEDLQLAYEQVSRDEIVSLPSKTTSFQAWAKGLSEYALSEVIEQESAYWLTALPQQPGHLPVDFHDEPNTEASARTVSVTLGSEETHALLHDVPSAYRSYINELLLSALAWSFSQETDESSLLIDLEGHGREELVAGADISRTVGWFTAIYPVLLKLENSSAPAAMLAQVKEQLRQIPNHGAGYGVARYLRNDNENAARLRALPQPEVSFNYLGQLDSAFAGDSLFASAQEIVSGLRNPQGQRRYLLEINASIIDRRLKLNWTYSQNAHHQSTIEKLAQNFLKALQAIISGSESPEASPLTPADFPLVKLTQSRLAQLCATFGAPEEIYPLAPVQEGLLFHSFYETRSGVYVEQLSLTLRGELNVSAFERAWQRVIDRHAILRTAFVWENLEQPLQVVSRDVVLRVATEDWRGISASEQAQRFESFLQADRKQSFDLQVAPLLRLALFRVADDVYRFVWSHHHLLLDGWSLPIVLNEVFTFYEQFSEGRELALKPAPQYWNFINWLKQQDSTASEAFWRQTLAGFSTPTSLTLDRRQEGVSDQGDLYGESQAYLSHATTTALQSFARRHHLTLHTVLQGAWALLLNRYSGAEDVVFGTIVSGRPVSLLEIQETVGIFINTLPVRIQVPSDGSLSGWLHELQNKQTELVKHEHTPLIQIQGWSEVPRGTPLFESVLSFLNYPITSALKQSRKDLHVEEVSWFEQTNYPLTMQVTPGSELLLKAIYDPQRFDAQTSERILGHFQTLLETMVQPDARLSTISVLTEGEEQQLAEWNETGSEYPREAGIHQLFEAQVERTPEAVAVRFGEQEISYRELNSRANQVAHYLRSLGVGPEVCVGVCLERSVDLVVDLVAILKAGGAYVPLDASYPLERLAYMLEDARIGMLVTTEKLLEVLPAHWAQVVCLDTEAELLGSLSEENLASEVSAENLAYVMYTSGSTGQPKGVSVVQRSVVRLVKETNYLEIGERDVFLQSAPISFDASTLEVWGSLLNGARLVLLEQERPTLEELGRAITGNGVTVLWLTAGLFHLMVEEQGAALLGVRRMLAGGDVLAVEQVRKYLAQMGAEGQLINGYGPTENTTFTCCHLMDRDSHWEGSVPIGKPIANTTVYVLDQQQREVPVGVYGEVYAGGDGLARGYLNGPALTAEKFVPHPFSAQGGERLYRTGDVGRWLSDGSIEFLGRVDEQVKLRGFRIELGEIEAALSRHAGVREAVVVVQEVNEDKRLVAYVVGEESLASGALRQYLKGVLPEYMVPQAFVQLERLPLTANGKVDRRALPAVEHVREETETEAAQTPVEEVLVGIWSEVLGVPVGVADDFFELGGHSLLATQVMSRVREVFGVEVGLRELFERPTVKELGQSIERELRQGAGVSAPPITSVARDSELPLSFAQQRFWFIDQMEPGTGFYNMPAALKLTGALDVEALERSLTEIVRRHEVLRTSFGNEAGRPVQVIHPATAVQLPLVELGHLRAEGREEQVRELAQAEAAQAFDLSQGPLWRAQLLRLSESEHVVLFTMHHIVSDGWSIAVLIKEVVALYSAFLAGEPSPLAELGLQYADYAVWQREYLQGEVLEQQLAYWRRQLEGAPTVLNLPLDHLRPALQGHGGALHPFSLSAGLTDSLKALSRREGATLYMTLVAAFSHLLQRYTQAEELLLGTPIAGRNHGESEPLIGLFVNTLVLRVDLSADPSFGELLGRVRRVCLEAHAHQEVPFEKLVEELQPERSLSHTPFFQVMFGLRNTPQEELELPGLSLQALELRREVAQFDLVLDLEESGSGIEGYFEYNSHVFERATIERIANHLQRLLEAIVAEPEQRLSTLRLLTVEEEAQQLQAWNPGCSEYPREQCLQHLFEAQVARTPEAPALECNGETLSYEELNRRANQLAHHLRELGVGPETVVGILLERSVAMMCSVLAVLKAGGAYLPLDVSLPEERLAFMVRDAGVKVLIGQGRFGDELPEAQVVLVDEAWEFAENSSSNPEVELSADSLAYVLYTSGSTGQPKATLIPHSAIVSSNWAVIERYGLGPADRVLQFASLSFDVSVEEIFPTWLSGGCVVLRPAGLLESHAAGWEFLRRERITVVNLPGIYWNELIATRRQSAAGNGAGNGTGAGNGAGELSLRLVAIGEEQVERFALTQEIVGPDVRLCNVYGLTETTVTTLTQDFGALEPGARSVPLGKPLANSQVYVLDQRQRLAPVGVSGEIYIGGHGLARGYLQRPALTAERFVPHPFGAQGGERLYRTGDVGRWLPDGSIEFLGRVDHQIKLRGFRVELGEIEAVLSRHSTVQEAVVVVQAVKNDERLVAYVVGEESVASGELRQYLKGMLPEYMVPQVWVQLERLPLTANGKVDRRALAAVEHVREETEQVVLAQTPVEEVLAGIWSEVLGVAQIGRDENFFELGGHSLLATQVMSRVREAFGVEVALRELFERPTVKELGQSIERELRQGAVSAPPITSVARDRELPLSFAQQRLWFIDQLGPGGTVYNLPLAVRLSGALNVLALEQTLNEIIKRHEVLRTSFAVVDEQPVQVIAPAMSLSLTVQELTGMAEAEREAEVLRQIEVEAQQPFDLSRGPLLRVKLWRLSESEHVVLLTMHHIITDGWSMGVLINEVAALYRAFAAGEAVPLPELPVQYADFALWQRERLAGEELERQLSYWRQQLAEAPALLALPTDRPRPPVQTFNGAHEAFTLSAETLQGLQRLSRSRDVTLFMTLLAVWQVLLQRYSGQTDIVVGADVANRNRAETEGLIGFFVNMLVLRTNHAGDPTFLELLNRVKEVCLGAYAHQDLPFEKLVEELQPERSLNYSPLFQVVFVLQNTPLGALELPGLVLNVIERERAEAQFDLILSMQEAEGKLWGTLHYNTDLFAAETIKRMLGHLQTLLAAVVADPAQQLSTLPLLTEAEEQQLAEWNETGSEYPREAGIHQLFEAQVERTPEAVAVSVGEQEISYRELNRRANQVAHYLRSLGVGPEVCVGVCLERSVDLVVALVAILKAGGAYVPLDSSYPLERLAYMLEDARIGLLVTTEKMLEVLPAHWAQVVCLDTEAEMLGSLSEENLTSEVNAENLAYVMYTSGSTGQPKGVSVVQRSVVRLVKETNYIHCSERDVFLQSAPISFDASTLEVWGSLLNGARLVLLEQERPTLEELARAITGNGVTVLWLTAGLFHLMVEEQGAALLGVRRMLAGGDVLAVEQVRKYLAEMGAESRLINGYGPTENTTFTCCHLMDRDSHWEGSVPIGKPIANTTVYVLDQQQREVPVGVYGEVYAGGDGLARGYLNGPALTAEKFVPHPFSARGGERLYRTGDVGRWLNDGSIEFLGRVDEQVKLRGFRIELGEIEAALSRHAEVREAVVVVQEVNEDKRLVAYVVGEESLQSGALRQYLKGVLPEYMVPQALVQIERLPLTTNGKVDRRALPAVEHVREETETEAAQTPVEEVLVGIWSEVLGVPVGVADDFFELGGHSLLATQVMSRVREVFGVEVGLRELFERPTVKELGQSIERELRQGAGVSAPPIERRERVGELPLSFAQQRLWFIDQMEPGSVFYNVPAAVRLQGHLQVDALARTFTEVLRRHEVLRTRFANVDGRAVQVIDEAAPVEFAVVDLSELEIEERKVRVREWSAQEAATPFDLSRGPLLRVKLLRLSEQEHVALLTMHHIVSDGWSVGVLIKEVGELYAAYAVGQESPLLELPIQYADFAVWQREYLQGEVLDQQLAYWRRQLSGAPKLLDLPSDHPRPAVRTLRGGAERFELDQELSEKLRALSQRESVTLFMLLLAVFKVLLLKYSGQADIVIGADVANRNRAETENLIGFFVNMLVLRTDLSGDPTFTELLQQVREVCLEAYAHQDLPFEKLVEELQPERSLSYAPLFQVVFLLQNAPAKDLHLPELTLSPVETESGTAKFDLVFGLLESNQRIVGNMEYSTDLFEAETIKRLLGHFHTLLAAVVADPAQRLSTLPLLTAAEAQQLAEWNNTTREYPRELIHQLFEAQVERTPEAVALSFEAQQLSYRELNDRANQLAHYLQGLGLGPESLVALYLDRSAEMVIAILAVLKAGAAYLPLDLSSPAERVAFMLQDAGASVLVTQDRLLEDLSAAGGVKLVCLDTEQARIAVQSVANPDSGIGPENLAYVIYTSGSSGAPKGTLLTHANVTRLLAATQDVFHFDERDVWTLFHSYAFDFSVWEIFGPLLTGGSVVVVPYLVSRAPAEFYELLRRKQVTVLNQTPSAFRQLMAVDEQQQEPLALRLVIFGGEALELESLSGWFARHAERPQLVNMYGITETTVHVTLRAVMKTDVEQQAGSVIGRAIDDLQLYVLDGQMEPTPVGVAGELYVGGAGLARGYLKRSALTAEKFVPHPFSTREGERLYRTGDVGRWLADGSVEYRGRLDEQVKLRGFRIELGEIETALSRHPGVRAAVVVARDEGHDDKRLVAYIVPEQQHLSTLGEQVLHRLPNDLAVFHLNKNETEHLYREIFEDCAYLKHGLTLSDGDCVFDIGANIGLFTLFAAQRCKNLQTFAFEPSPVAFEKLRLNVERFGLQASLFACGLSNQEGSATFTYYPQASVMSGFYPNAREEKELFRSFMLNQPHAGGADEQALLSEYAEELTDGRFASERFNCQLRTISSIIAEYRLECVDLLKVDVEKSEADVLEGVNEADWAKIKQVVVEVHDLEGRLNRVLSLLRKQGFEIAQEVLAAGTGVYNIFARRAQGNGFPAAQGQATSQSLRVVAHYTLSSGDLRRYLKETLPDYMVPASYVMLEKLPLTANGKVDRRALPAPQYSENGLARDHAGPRTVTEEILGNIWLTILGVAEISIEDNFFELGGHSLLATQLMSRVREAFGVEVSLRELFERPTVKELAERIERELRQGTGMSAPPIKRRERVGELPLSFAQQRLWFIDQLEPGRAFYNVPAAVRLKGSLNQEALAHTLTEVISRHEVLRTRFGTVAGRAVQVIDEAAPVELEVVELSELEVEEREARVREWSVQEAATPFDLSRGPLLRVKLLRLGEQEHVVLLTMHHIVVDGWSLGILIREIATLYEASIGDRPSPLPELPIQYADFALWQRAYLQGEVLEQQLTYWREHLAGAETVLKLPTDKPRPAIYSYRAATHKFVLPTAVTAPLHKLSQEEGCTLFMTLLASFKTLLYRYSEQEDILVGTAIANRNRSETEALIGFFVNTLALRTDLSGNPSFRKLMQRVRETTLGAYVHQDMPFEKLVEELQPERSLSHAPLFQVVFGINNTPFQTLTLPGLELSQMEVDFDAGKFDLTLLVSEDQDELSGVWYYNTDLFEAATIKRMQRHFETILQNVLAQPDLPLSEIEMLTDDEKKQKIVQEQEQLESNAVVLRTIRRKGISMPQSRAVQTELN